VQRLSHYLFSNDFELLELLVAFTQRNTEKWKEIEKGITTLAWLVIPFYFFT